MLPRAKALLARAPYFGGSRMRHLSSGSYYCNHHKRFFASDSAKSKEKKKEKKNEKKYNKDPPVSSSPVMDEDAASDLAWDMTNQTFENEELFPYFKYDIMELTRNDYLALFSALDTNQNGFIEYHELVAGLKRFGFILPEKQSHKLMKIADTNEDGEIDKEEFITFVDYLMSKQRKKYYSAYISSW